MSYVFPVSFLFNTFAMTALLVCLGLMGKPTMAADVGLVQGATLALFYAFSANARNLILNPSPPTSVRSMLVARLFLIVPLGYVSFYLSVYMANVEGPLACVLILRRCVEWVNELHLSQSEIHGDRQFARKFFVLQLILLCVALGWTLSDAPMPLLGLFLWALLPLLMSLGFIRERLAETGQLEEAWHQMLPHLGSTAVTGITVYVFRLLIMLLVGKESAGDLYTAFAIGGAVSSIFSNALGPSLMFHGVQNGARHFPALLEMSLSLWFVAGVILSLGARFADASLEWTGKSSFFLGAMGLSMVGGVVMVFAQRIRLRLLQLFADRDVFGPDVLMNILILASAPYLYYLGGKDAVMALYLFNASLALLFYFSSEGGFFLRVQRVGLSSDTLRGLIAFLLVFPLFFQLSGNIFHDSLMGFDSGGALSQLPVPLSVLACYGGILLLGGYQRAYLSLWFIFVSFVTMLIASVISAHDQIDKQQGKLLLLLQFVLPMFALVLGQIYEASERNTIHFEKVFLHVLAVLVPLQLLSTWMQGQAVLFPHVYLFSIYQHIQYVPVILVCCYLLALYSLWRSSLCKKILLFLAPLMGIYAAASTSMLALFALGCGVLGFVFYCWRPGFDRPLAFLGVLIIVAVIAYFPFLDSQVKNRHLFSEKYAFLGVELTLPERQQ